ALRCPAPAMFGRADAGVNRVAQHRITAGAGDADGHRHGLTKMPAVLHECICAHSACSSIPPNQSEDVTMTELPYRTALIVGAGAGISASVARALAAAGLKLGLAARNIDKLAPLAAETGAERFAADASDPAAVAQLFEEAGARIGPEGHPRRAFYHRWRRAQRAAPRSAEPPGQHA